MLGLMGVRSGVDLGAVLALARGGVRETIGYPLESAVLRAGKVFGVPEAATRGGARGARGHRVRGRRQWGR
jgi:hypothetical protein